MKKTITRTDILNSIIKLIDEYRSDCVEEDATLGRLHIGVNTVEWMYDWLAEEYSSVKMTRPSKEEIQQLIKGDTIGKLADIAMKHIEGSLEIEVEDKKDEGDVRKTAEFHFETLNDGVGSMTNPEKMTRDEFLKKCGEFYDNRGTHCNDFEIMSVKIDV